MLHLVLIVLALIHAVSAGPLISKNLQNSTSLNVRKPEDVDVQTIGPSGSALTAKRAIIFLHVVMLDIYKGTVSMGRDEVIPEEVWERDFGDLILQLAPRESSKMTWADALWGVQAVLRNMLYPLHCDGFREQRWEVGRNRKEDRGATMIKLGEILLSLKGPSDSRLELKSNVSIWAVSPSRLPPPFPVPETDITLLIGARGGDLPRAPVIQALDGMVSKGYIDFAIHRHARSLPQQTAMIQDASGTTYVIMRPRMSSGVSLLTTTDLVETAVGIVYYMVQNGFFATTITALRPNDSERRIAVGEMEIRMDPRRVNGLGEGNNSSLAIA